MDPIVLHVRDANLQRVCQVEDYKTAQLIPRFNDVGGWLIDGIPIDSPAGIALQPGAGIVATQGDRVVLSGPLLFPEISWDANGYQLSASGSDDMLAVFGRLTFPDPTMYPDASGQWAVYSDDRGPAAAETVMKGYVDANAGPSALSARRWAGLTIAPDTALGDTISFSARNWMLGDLLTQLALGGGGLRYNVVQSGSSLVFDVTDPVDRSNTARFSPTLGNLQHLKYGRKMAATNWVLVGGGDEGVTRVFVTGSNPDSITTWGMVLEGFKDQRQTTVPSELAAAADEELATKGDQLGLELEPIDTTAVAYGTDYDVGDQVTVVVNGLAVVEVMREARIQIEGDAVTVYPIVGTPGQVLTGTDDARAVDLLFSRLRQMTRRLSLLEVAH